MEPGVSSGSGGGGAGGGPAPSPGGGPGSATPPAAPGGGGWRFTLRVPSWSLAQLPDGEAAVFYQVEVTVLPPAGEPRKRSVGRRFSAFLVLHRRVGGLGGVGCVGWEQVAQPPASKQGYSGVRWRDRSVASVC